MRTVLLPAGILAVVAMSCTIDLSDADGSGTDAALTESIVGTWENRRVMAGTDSVLITNVAIARNDADTGAACFLQGETILDTTTGSVMHSQEYAGTWYIGDGNLYRDVQLCLLNDSVQSTCTKTFPSAGVVISGDSLELDEGSMTVIYMKKGS